MEQHQAPREPRGEPAVYQITVKGQLSADWCAWFDGMTITQDAAGATLITGPVADQAALHGLLRKVRDLGLTLVALRSSEPMTIRTNTPNLLDTPSSD